MYVRCANFYSNKINSLVYDLSHPASLEWFAFDNAENEEMT